MKTFETDISLLEDDNLIVTINALGTIWDFFSLNIEHHSGYQFSQQNFKLTRAKFEEIARVINEALQT